MNPDPFPFQDFRRAQESLERALTKGQETYLLLTGDTGTGKTALLNQLRRTLDRTCCRTLYFSHSRKLRASGLVRVLTRVLHLPYLRSHAESVQVLVRHFHEERQRLVLWLDEGQDLPEETLLEVRSLAESELGGQTPLQIFFAGLPALRERLQALPPLWRRIVVREEITGLKREELPAFLEHHFEKKTAERLGEEGRALLFERGRGIPGLILPMLRTVLRECPGQGTIDPLHVEDTLSRWDLP